MGTEEKEEKQGSKKGGKQRPCRTRNLKLWQGQRENWQELSFHSISFILQSIFPRICVCATEPIPLHQNMIEPLQQFEHRPGVRIASTAPSRPIWALETGPLFLLRHVFFPLMLLLDSAPNAR